MPGIRDLPEPARIVERELPEAFTTVPAAATPGEGDKPALVRTANVVDSSATNCGTRASESSCLPRRRETPPGVIRRGLDVGGYRLMITGMVTVVPVWSLAS